MQDDEYPAYLKKQSYEDLVSIGYSIDKEAQAKQQQPGGPQQPGAEQPQGQPVAEQPQGDKVVDAEVVDEKK